MALAAAATSSAGGGGGGGGSEEGCCDNDDAGGGDAAIEAAMALTSIMLVEKNETLPCLCGRGEGTPPQKRDLRRARELTKRAREPTRTLLGEERLEGC